MRRVSLHRLARARDPLIVAALVAALDLSTKSWARHALAHHARHVVGPIWLRLAYNSGFSFSWARGVPTLAATLSIAALVVVAVCCCFTYTPGAKAGFGLLLGGGASNLIDRVSSAHHHVTDFIAVSSFSLFNLADAAITAGIVVLGVVALLGHRILAK